VRKTRVDRAKAVRRARGHNPLVVVDAGDAVGEAELMLLVGVLLDALLAAERTVMGTRRASSYIKMRRRSESSPI
jgi:hypothetical protein